MATSSIIEKIRVNNPKDIEAFVEAMDSSGENYHIITKEECSTLVSDPERIKKFVQRCLEKKQTGK